VAEGIQHFKEGRHSEAFQCLNKALSIDARNVEGLVARGALYANSRSFHNAITDFEAALKINQNHANAKKYLGETLLALGRSYEDDNKFEEAQKAYINCLNINPHHQEALASLNYIKNKLNARKIVEPAELELPRKTTKILFSIKIEIKITFILALNIGSIPPLKESKRDYHDSLRGKEDGIRSKKSKKEKKKKGKKRHSSSSDSSSESSDSSESTSESSNNSSSTSGVISY
jgi:tetratricopeptide (TPR) repeat protein